MDTTQILIVVTLSVTTLFLVVVGYQVVQILRELRIMMQKANSIVENFERMGNGLENGFNELTGFIGGFKSVFKILEIFQKRRRGQQTTSSDTSPL